jgi:methylphosphotriester-DNA--protein-cysteine methyltransferase
LAVGGSRHGYSLRLKLLAQGKSVTEAAVAVGYDSMSAFIEMFHKMLGTTPQMYFRNKQEPVPK